VKPPQSDAAKRALGLWKQSSRSTRLHTAIRWWTAPFEALETEVPRSGKILEVGCGHGMLATFLALSSVDRTVVGVDIDAAPVLESVQVWANYAIVSNKERILMGKSQRTILIEQVQIAPRQSFNPKANPVPSYDVRFNHAVKALFFQVRNSTFANQWSNYTTASPVVTPTTTAIDYESRYARDPIKHTTLIYENSNRFSNMGSDYFSLVNPYYHAPACPTDTGYHLYSYSLKFNDLDPMGSTNYGKLSNVSLVPAASDDAIIASNGTGPVLSGTNFGQTFEFIVTVIVNNIIRIAGGTMGFPVL